jgi:DNA-binding transcriptional MerR regulator
MSAGTEPLWTIDELGAMVALALSVGYSGQANGRVRDVPDRRTIRYYTTLGLIDRPARMRGRTALYGRRHLLQLVAIKRLQARGTTLAELQQQLLGLTDAGLTRLARLPADLDLRGEPEPPRPSRRDGAFWKELPAAEEEPQTLQGIRLDDGATLLLSAARAPEPDDIEAIRAVAAPLLKLLHQRRLLSNSNVSPTRERGTT